MVKTNAARLFVCGFLSFGIAVAGPLHDAAREGDVEQVRRLVEQGAELEEKDNENAAPLHWAAYFDRVELAAVLLEAGADVHSATTFQRMPLHIAAMQGSTGVATLLLDNGARVDALDTEPVSALALAVITGKVAMVELLLDRGANVNLKLAGGTIVLHGGLVNSPANGTERRELTVRLLERGADVDARTTEERNSPLHSAASWDAVEVAELLIAAGADVRAEDALGHHPLHNAAAMGYVEIAGLLIAGDADVNATDDKVLTPLHWAAAKGRLRGFLSDFGFVNRDLRPSGDYRATIEKLIETGADVNARNKKGRTPLTVAKRSKSKDLVALIEEHGGSK